MGFPKSLNKIFLPKHYPRDPFNVVDPINNTTSVSWMVIIRFTLYDSAHDEPIYRTITEFIDKGVNSSYNEAIVETLKRINQLFDIISRNILVTYDNGHIHCVIRDEPDQICMSDTCHIFCVPSIN